MRISPIRVNFSDVSGNCLIGTAFETPLQLKFGYDSVYTCIGTSSNFLANLTSTFNRISRLGSVQSSDTTSFATVTQTTSSNSNGVSILQIYYSRIGREGNSMFQVVYASALISSTSNNNRCQLFVEYKQVDSSVLTYVPSPPSVQAYLPNDVLYPFYVSA